MAHAATINALTEQLVESITKSSPSKNARHFRACKDAASKRLKSHNFGRVNQFAVQKSLEGLIEKFEILNKDELATELSSRLTRLAELETHLEPEYLSFLLHLSDRPADKVGINQLESANTAEEPLPPALTWEDILADDPLEDPGLWENDIDGRSISSAEESESADGHTLLEPSQSAKALNEDIKINEPQDLERLKIKVDELALENVQKARLEQRHAQSRGDISTTELRVIRDVLFALLGLPSSLFGGQPPSARHSPTAFGAIEQVSTESFADLLSYFARISYDILILRNFVDSRQKEPLLQRFAHAAGGRLDAFDTYVAEKQKVFAAPEGPVLVSIMDLASDVDQKSKPLLQLKDPVLLAQQLSKGITFRLLDDLYDRTCTAQAICDDRSFKFFAEIFLECLPTFLQSVALWMERGEVVQGLELVTTGASGEYDDPATFWKNKFSISFSDSRPSVPYFAIEVSDYIFSSGKSIAFLTALGMNETEDAANPSIKNKQAFSFESIQGNRGIDSLFPFDLQFKREFHTWVKERHQMSSSVLKDYFVSRCGLLQTVEALEYIFLSKDGAAFQNFADKLFQRIDGNKATWNDTFAIEDLAQKHLGEHQCIDRRSIGAKQAVTPREMPRRSIEGISTVRLSYEISWQNQNIIPRSNLYIYQRCLVFLLQVYRSSSLLSRLRRRPRDKPKEQGLEDHDISSSTQLTKQVEALTYFLQHRLLQFTTTIHKYLTESAIRIPSITLRWKLLQAQDIDSMIAAYSNYTKTLDRKCLFSSEVESGRHAILQVLDLARSFHDSLCSPQRGGDRVGYKESSQKRQGSDLDTTTWGWESDSEDAGDDERGVVSDLNLAAHAPHEDPETKLLQLEQMRSQLSHLLSIAIANLYSGSRSEGGEEIWAQLAESLEWTADR